METRVTQCAEKSIVIIIASKVQGSTYKPRCKMNYSAAYISPPLAQAPMSRFPIRPVPVAVTIGGQVVNYNTQPPPEKSTFCESAAEWWCASLLGWTGLLSCCTCGICGPCGGTGLLENKWPEVMSVCSLTAGLGVLLCCFLAMCCTTNECAESYVDCCCSGGNNQVAPADNDDVGGAALAGSAAACAVCALCICFE